MRELALLVLCAGCSAPPAPAAVRAEAPSAVGMARRDYDDPQRPSWDGGGPRPLRALVWYPATPDAAPDDVTIGPPAGPLFRAGRAAAGAPIASGRHPLVLLSHGTGGAALQLMWLGQALASRGYVAVAVNHHGNTFAEPRPTPQGFVLWWERARDLRVLLDRVLADAELGPHIDAARIGAAGFSIGGYTVAALAGARTDLGLFEAFCKSPERDATCLDQKEYPDAAMEFAAVETDPAVAASLARAGADYRDARIRAVVAIAPAVTHAFTPASLHAIGTPMLILGGDSDTTAPVATNAAHLAEGVPGATLVRVRAAHYSFLAECTPAGRERLGYLCADPTGVDRAEVHRDVADRAIAFFNRALAP